MEVSGVDKEAYDSMFRTLNLKPNKAADNLWDRKLKNVE